MGGAASAGTDGNASLSFTSDPSLRRRLAWEACDTHNDCDDVLKNSTNSVFEKVLFCKRLMIAMVKKKQRIKA